MIISICGHRMNLQRGESKWVLVPNFVQYRPTEFRGMALQETSRFGDTRICASMCISSRLTFSTPFWFFPILLHRTKTRVGNRPLGSYMPFEDKSGASPTLRSPVLVPPKEIRRSHSTSKQSFWRPGIQHHGWRSPVYSLQRSQPLEEALTMAMDAFLTMIHQEEYISMVNNSQFSSVSPTEPKFTQHSQKLADC